MNAELQEVIGTKTIPEIFLEGGTDYIVSKIEEEARSLVPDTSTAIGRKAIASNAAKVSRSKTYLDGLGKDLVAGLKKQTSAVDAERRAMRARLDALKEHVRQPLTDYDEAEKAREQAILDRIAAIGGETPTVTAQLREYIEGVELIKIDSSWGKHAPAAAMRKDAELQRLRHLLTESEAEEKRQAESAALAERERKEREKRIAEEAGKKATREAQQAALDRVEEVRHQAECKRIAQERKIIEAERRASAAEQARASAEANAKRQVDEAKENARKEAEALAQKEADDRARAERLKDETDALRAANRSHRAKVNSEALASLMTTCGLDEDAAKIVIIAVANGQVARLRIEY